MAIAVCIIFSHVIERMCGKSLVEISRLYNVSTVHSLCYCIEIFNSRMITSDALTALMICSKTLMNVVVKYLFLLFNTTEQSLRKSCALEINN